MADIPNSTLFSDCMSLKTLDYSTPSTNLECTEVGSYTLHLLIQCDKLHDLG